MQGRCCTHVEAMHGDFERQERLIAQGILGCLYLGEGAGWALPCSACPTGAQLWIADMHTEDVEETFYSRIDQDIWFLLQFNIFLIATKDKVVFTCL